MPESMSMKQGEPAAEVLIAPSYPPEGHIPFSPDKVLRNISSQLLDERRFSGYQREKDISEEK